MSTDDRLTRERMDGGTPCDQNTLAEHLRALALSLPEERRRPLRGPSSQALTNALQALACAPQEEADSGEDAALAWLSENARATAVLLTGLCGREKHPTRLPATGRTPRVLSIARQMLRESDALVTPRRMEAGLAAFDEVRALTMAEVHCAPRALACACGELFLSLCGEALSDAEDARLARAFAQSPAGDAALPEGRPLSPAFAARAAALLEEMDDTPDRAEKLRLLQAAAPDLRPRDARRAALERASLSRLLGANLLATLRGLEGALPSESFARLSRTEQALRRDPAGTYPQMDEPSRELVRRMASLCARRARVPEHVAAETALSMAESGEGLRREVTYYLYTDEGLKALMTRLGAARRRPVLHPDPTGTRRIRAILCLSLLSEAALWAWAKTPLALLAAPVVYALSERLTDRALMRLLPPRPLLRLELSKGVGPSRRTLLTMPVLLTDEGRARALAEQLETLGAATRDPDVDFLLLADLPDAKTPVTDADAGILSAARAAVEALNERAPRPKYHLLTRARAYDEANRRWLAPDRKRGAILSLCALLAGEGAQSAFREPLSGGPFRYVLTLDAGGRMLPGDMALLVGALAHPLNRRHAFISPRTEPSPDGAVNPFARLLFGQGGPDTYPVHCSDVYQETAGRGICCGKGVLDARAFLAAVEGKLPRGRILSHDLIEGLLAGAGQMTDAALFEDPPRSARGWITRLHRWTRGDWQLLPMLFCRRLGLDALGRFLLADNLMRSLLSPARIACLLAGLSARSLPLALCFFLPDLPAPGREALSPVPWLRALCRLLLTPMEAACALDAIPRTLYRLTVSGRHLLDWTPFDDAQRGSGRVPFLWACPAAGAACLLINPCALPLAAGFFAVPRLLRRLEKPFAEERTVLSEEERAKLADLAKRTWRFFTDTLEQSALPPDNEQVDPPLGVARRTSPTNIGMYLIACVSALRLGLIGREEAVLRAEATLSALQALPKWRGHLYNWYDTASCAPLTPRVVSSVDSGNLAAAILLLSRALPETAPRAAALAQDMDFAALYDEKRGLFHVSFDEESGRLSESRYDLLASEARLTSFTALMLGKVDLKHWSRLSRARTRVGRSAALLSWSGTAFEYLMPELLLPTVSGTLLRRTRDAVIQAQTAFGRETNRPFGVSESGYCAFDRGLAYQYRAFGLPELALSGDCDGNVTAPYAAALALPFRPKEAMRALGLYERMGMLDAHGLYEAADFDPARLGEQELFRPVKSHMAHHQGMILAALCNALTGFSLQKTFMDIPQARGLSLLLMEKDASLPRPPLPPRLPCEESAIENPRTPTHRMSEGVRNLPEPLLLTGGGESVCVLCADGQGSLTVRGIQVNRPRTGLADGRREGFFVHLCLPGRGACLSLTTVPARLDMGLIRWEGACGEAAFALTECLSPGDGALCQLIKLENASDEPLTVELTSCFEVALARRADYGAHPAFQNLSVTAIRPEGRAALAFRRRSRGPGDDLPTLIHCAAGVEPEDGVFSCCDLERLIPRGGDLYAPSPAPLEWREGEPLSPASALRLRMTLPAKGTREVAFFVGLADGEGAGTGKTFLAAHGDVACARRAVELARVCGRSPLPPALWHLYERASALMWLPRPLPTDSVPEEDPSPRALWSLGLSGEAPLILLFADRPAHAALARQAAGFAAFLREGGLSVDGPVILIREQPGYRRPVRDAFIQIPGALLLDEADLTSAQRGALLARAPIRLRGGAGSLRSQLSAHLREAEKAAPRHVSPIPAQSRPPKGLLADNGWGGFLDGDYWVYRLSAPGPWCNLLCGPHAGMVATAWGGGYAFAGNSRLARLTAFTNDELREDYAPLLLTLNGMPLAPRAARMQPGRTRYTGRCGDSLLWQADLFADPEHPLLYARLLVTNRASSAGAVTLRARIRWSLGAAPWGTLQGAREGEPLLFARGDAGALALLAFTEGVPEGAAEADGDALTAHLTLQAGESRPVSLTLALGENLSHAKALMDEHPSDEREQANRRFFGEYLSARTLVTPDPLLCALVNRWLPAQVLCARLWGRTGYFQSGGAIGFRDQLQDMLSQIGVRPNAVRAHLLECAAHQFESGDVMHWWHPPRTGVRTRVSDDLLFLPYVTACYVRETGDESVLFEPVNYLADVEIPLGREDWYGEAQVSKTVESLRAHCLLALDRAWRVGAHGLLLMGSGDWNDGMNRVGSKGKGESVWLSMFYQAAAGAFLPLCPEEDRARLQARMNALHDAVETHGWDGGWYRRAFDDEGNPVGSAECAECKVDLLSQCWAVLAGQDERRARQGLLTALSLLTDREHGLLKLLTPPFDGRTDPGYIKGYPAGVRENGGQYTHAACWAVIALAKLGLADEAWSLFRMLMPYTHADAPEKAALYRAEPYVLAGDIYGEAPHAGRGGWSWYTGAAGWMLVAAYHALMGLSCAGGKARLSPLLPREWDEAQVVLSFGRARYTLVARREAASVTLDGRNVPFVPLIDDAGEHVAVFPPRLRLDLCADARLRLDLCADALANRTSGGID